MKTKQPQNKTKNAEEFLRVFKEIEHYLQKLYNRPQFDNFSVLIRQASQKNNAIKEFNNDLFEYLQLRNALSHAKSGDLIAEVFESTVDEIKHISRLIINPPLVIELFKVEVFTCNIKDNLIDILKIMKEKIFTHVPVYDNGLFIGILSEGTVTRWLQNLDKNLIDLKEIKVIELKDYLRESNDEKFLFINKNMDIFNIGGLFVESIQNGKRLGAIFITETGEENEDLLGIITAWDLPKVKNVMVRK